MPLPRGISHPSSDSGKGQIGNLKFNRKAAIMPINHRELIEEIETHIRKFGGGFGEWCVGTAKDSRGPFFRRHLAADLGDGLTYREAFTTDAAQGVVAHLVNDRGLERFPEAEPGSDDRRAERRSALRQPAESSSAAQDAVSEPGRLVFVYRKTATTNAALPSEQAVFPRRAA
jgi:hypothetical protein